MLSLIAATSTIAEIRAWIQSGEADRIRLRIVETGLDVQIEKTRHRQIRYHNIWSSMPPETHSIEDNPLYELLKRKLEQLTGGQPETFRCIFLAHVGSTLLRRVGRDGEIDSTRRRVSGREIISHFVSAYADRIDSVVVFAPYREGLFMGQTRLRWSVSTFNRPGLKADESGLARLVALLTAATVPRLPRALAVPARCLLAVFARAVLGLACPGLEEGSDESQGFGARTGRSARWTNHRTAVPLCAR